MLFFIIFIIALWVLTQADSGLNRITAQEDLSVQVQIIETARFGPEQPAEIKTKRERSDQHDINTTITCFTSNVNKRLNVLETLAQKHLYIVNGIFQLDVHLVSKCFKMIKRNVHLTFFKCYKEFQGAFKSNIPRMFQNDTM